MFKTKKEIEDWIINNSFAGIPEFTINNDLTVDCESFCSTAMKIKELPVRFRTIKENFNLTWSGIENLKGFPESCKRLYINGNNLTSLEGCPKDCRYINCRSNKNLYEYKELPFNIEELDCYLCPIYEIYLLFGEALYLKYIVYLNGILKYIKRY
jgi:hypothetical protein